MKTHLVFAILTAVLLALLISQDRRKTFEFDFVIAQAERLAREDHEPTKPVGNPLRGLNYDQYRDIRWRDDYTLWRKKGLPFQAEFFLTGHIHSKPVTIYQINRDGTGPVRFDPTFFDFGKTELTPADAARGGYAGFRVHHPINRSDVLDEIFVFLGASYFRAVARDLVWGLSARGLAIDTLGKEEFPDFTTFWLVGPPRGATQMTLYALLESPGVTGAYEFEIHPGVETRMEVRAVLFPRRNIEGIGIAPLTSMFWYGENTNNTFGNFRPEVHDSDGLLLERGNGEWIWRPLSWSQQLQVSVFEDENPKGFGLLQRDRDFTHYQDLEALYDRRPSAWVWPRGDWGAGSVQLIQLPTKDEYIDNVVAYWTPAGGLKKGTRHEFAYTLLWYREHPDLPPLGRTLFTRIDFLDAKYYRMFVLDFGAGELSRVAPDAPVTADVWVRDGAVKDVVVQKNTYGDSWRVTFIASSGNPNKPVELGCTLRLDGRALTETWTYTWKN